MLLEPIGLATQEQMGFRQIESESEDLARPENDVERNDCDHRNRNGRLIWLRPVLGEA
jgi:hypothetical protein